jgi:UDP-2,3-diacylglucosamine pyrophosphatase LpxH
MLGCGSSMHEGALREPLVVLSDVHLSATGKSEVAKDLAELVRRSPGHELILAGDVFDLSTEPRDQDVPATVAQMLRAHGDLARALREHLRAGAGVTLIAGNHDAAAATPEVRRVLLRALELVDEAKLDVSPWFVRRGRVHLEHGHLYDPDNAPAHPLAPWSWETEPLGIALTRRFLAPSGALMFAHAHETTPADGLLRAFRIFGPRAPWVVARYFATAIALCAQAGRQRGVARELEHGANALLEFAEECGLAVEMLTEMVTHGPRPTHLDFKATFMRLYFDRVIASVGLLAGASAALLGRSVLGASVAALSGSYLLRSVKSSGSRYSGLTEQRLREAALVVADATDASLVVFGHTHREDEAPRYVNCGSFGYPKCAGRPYVVVDSRGQAQQRRFELSAGAHSG